MKVFGVGVGAVELLRGTIVDLGFVLVGSSWWTVEFCVGLSGGVGFGDGVEVGLLSWNSVQCWSLLGRVVAAEGLGGAIIVLDIVFGRTGGWWCWVGHRVGEEMG